VDHMYHLRRSSFRILLNTWITCAGPQIEQSQLSVSPVQAHKQVKASCRSTSASLLPTPPGQAAKGDAQHPQLLTSQLLLVFKWLLLFKQPAITAYQLVPTSTTGAD
jgi:hypothetical protein